MPEQPVTTIEESSDLVVIRIVPDRLEEDQLRAFQRELRAAAETHSAKPFVLDLSAVNFLPSLSLGALIRVHTEFRDRRQRLVLAGLQPHVRDLIVMTQLNRIFDVKDDVAAATRSLRPA